MRDYRSISLISSIYKIISKTLAERMKRVIEKIVSKHQMAFIKGRQIIDASLIANECVDARQKAKKSGILCKLDIEKAFDHVNWKYLINIMRVMGFRDKWLKWIYYCISTVKFSVLINGMDPLKDFFNPKGD